MYPRQKTTKIWLRLRFSQVFLQESMINRMFSDYYFEVRIEILVQTTNPYIIRKRSSRDGNSKRMIYVPEGNINLLCSDFEQVDRRVQSQYDILAQPEQQGSANVNHWSDDSG
jgi:hypothetical protein